MAKKDEPETPPAGGKDWRDKFFEDHQITEDEDKSFLNSRALADEFVEESRKQRAKPPDKKSKRLFGGRNSD